MKIFYKKILGILGVLAVIFISLLSVRYLIMNNLSWKLPPQKHVLFMGASELMRGIDDSLLESGFNFTSSSERYMFTYIKLNHLLEWNEQIDIIFLHFAPTDLWEHTDDKYYMKNEQTFFVPLYWPLFDTENWEVYGRNLLQPLKLILSSLYKPSYYSTANIWYELGHYMGKADNNKVMNRQEVKPDLIKGKYGHEVNYRYLRRIIDLCKQKGVKLYFLYCPVFHPEYYYDQDYYYKSYERYFSDVELLDYSHYPVEENERFDAHHLNHKGAQRFTKLLQARFGFK